MGPISPVRSMMWHYRVASLILILAASQRKGSGTSPLLQRMEPVTDLKMTLRYLFDLIIAGIKKPRLPDSVGVFSVRVFQLVQNCLYLSINSFATLGLAAMALNGNLVTLQIARNLVNSDCVKLNLIISFSPFQFNFVANRCLHVSHISG